MKKNIISSHFWLKERMFLRLSSCSLSINKSTFHKIDYQTLSFNIYLSIYSKEGIYMPHTKIYFVVVLCQHTGVCCCRAEVSGITYNPTQLHYSSIMQCINNVILISKSPESTTRPEVTKIILF